MTFRYLWKEKKKIWIITTRKIIEETSLIQFKIKEEIYIWEREIPRENYIYCSVCYLSYQSVFLSKLTTYKEAGGRNIPSWNTDFLASNNFFHTLLNSLGIFDRAGFFHSPDLSSGIFPFTKILSFLSRVFSFTLIWIFDLYSKFEDF